MVKAKEKKGAVLYALVKEKNKTWVKKNAKKLGYTLSEYLDLVIDELRGKK